MSCCPRLSTLFLVAWAVTAFLACTPAERVPLSAAPAASTLPPEGTDSIAARSGGGVEADEEPPPGGTADESDPSVDVGAVDSPMGGLDGDFVAAGTVTDEAIDQQTAGGGASLDDESGPADADMGGVSTNADALVVSQACVEGCTVFAACPQHEAFCDQDDFGAMVNNCEVGCSVDLEVASIVTGFSQDGCEVYANTLYNTLFYSLYCGPEEVRIEVGQAASVAEASCVQECESHASCVGGNGDADACAGVDCAGITAYYTPYAATNELLSCALAEGALFDCLAQLDCAQYELFYSDISTGYPCEAQDQSFASACQIFGAEEAYLAGDN